MPKIASSATRTARTAPSTRQREIDRQAIRRSRSRAPSRTQAGRSPRPDARCHWAAAHLRGCSAALLAGSATLVQTLMRHNLIDEYRVAVHPIVLGGGTQLFPQGGVSSTLQLTGTRTLDSGVVSLTYVPADRD